MNEDKAWVILDTHGEVSVLGFGDYLSPAIFLKKKDAESMFRGLSENLRKGRTIKKVKVFIESFE